MTRSPALEIEGHSVDWGKVWVHLQRPKGIVVHYSASIPQGLADKVFGPKRGECSWVEHIKARIDLAGTFFVGGYFSEMTKIAGAAQKPYEWVIATVDEVIEDSEGIRLLGKAVPFDHSRGVPELKPLA